MKLRFSVTALLAAIVLLGAPLARLHYHLNQRGAYLNELRELKRRGAGMGINVAIEKPYLYQWYDGDEDWIEEIHSVHLRGEVDDDDLRLLQPLPNLQQVYIRHTNVTDVGLLHLTQIPKLKMVRVSSHIVTDEGVRRFRQNRPDVQLMVLRSLR